MNLSEADRIEYKCKEILELLPDIKSMGNMIVYKSQLIVGIMSRELNLEDGNPNSEHLKICRSIIQKASYKIVEAVQCNDATLIIRIIERIKMAVKYGKKPRKEMLNVEFEELQKIENMQY